MFNTVQKHQKLVKGIMIIITITFIVWGIGNYFGMMGQENYIAKIGDKKIYPQEVDNIMQQNKQFTDKSQLILLLINRELLISNAKDKNLTTTTSELQEQIAKIPEFQESGIFSLKKYKKFLHDNKITSDEFQKNSIDQLVLTKQFDFFKNSYFSSKKIKNSVAQLLSQSRNVSLFTISPKQFYSQIKISESEIHDNYTQNISQFTHPEQVKVSYLELSPDTVASTIKIDNKKINTYIKEHESELANVQVDVSHILISVPNANDPVAKVALRAKALKILQDVRKNPNQFAKFAQKYSDDPGSANKGGDLGFFSRGAMVKPFEDIAFSLHKNEISGIVETKFGYHILKLNAKKQNSQQQITELALKKLQLQEANFKIQEQSNQLNNLTYNHPHSLIEASKALNLKIMTSPWISKTNATGDFANPDVQKAIFNIDFIKNHNNTNVITLGNNKYVVYNLVDYKKTSIDPLIKVRNQIIAQIKNEKANKIAVKFGQEQLAKLQTKKINLLFKDSQTVTILSQNPKVNAMSIKQIFDTQITKLPAFTGSINDKNEYVIYKINKEFTDQKLFTQNIKMLTERSENDGNIILNAYVDALKDKYPVTYNTDQNNK